MRVLLLVAGGLWWSATAQRLPDQKCDRPALETGVAFQLGSHRNGSGQWVAEVSAGRWIPVGVSGSDGCQWTLQLGHEVTHCPLANRGVRLTATVHKQGNVTDKEIAALAVAKLEVPPALTVYKYSLDQHEYKLDLRLVKWETARAFCQAEGGDLVVLNSDREAELMSSILQEQGVISEDPYENKQVWVGLHDTGKEGQFQTVYGDDLSWTGYSKWAPGEPNDLGSGEDCVSMLRNAKYNDEICNKKLAFICERPRHVSLYS